MFAPIVAHFAHFLAENPKAAARLAHTVRDYQHTRKKLAHLDGDREFILALAQEKGGSLEQGERKAYLLTEARAGA